MNNEPKPFINMNINNDTSMNQMPPIEPITPIMPTTPVENMSSIKDNNNFINLNNSVPKPQKISDSTEELDMDIDFQDIDEPAMKKMNEIDNLLKTQNQMPEFNPNLSQQNDTQIPKFEFGQAIKPSSVAMPEFNPKLNQPLQTSKRDIRPIISDIRQTVNNIQREGFVVDLEEFDYENTYQVVIKIQK